MRICPNCGQENPDEFKFCPACATSLDDTALEGATRELGIPDVAEAGPREMRKMVTVVFCDLTGSTTIGEQIDPETLRRMMERYYERMRGVLERHGGAVEKMIGDAVMGVFGIPVLREDDALRAVRAAFEMREALDALNHELEERWGVRLLTRTGVNTGQTIASTIDSFVTGGVAGDAVNVAARLEQAATPGEILIGEVTYGLVRDAVEVESMGPLELKGKGEGVPAYRLLAVGERAKTNRRSDAPMVGRDEPFARLRGALDRSLEARTVEMVTVIGNAGVGKSRLVDEFLEEARERATILSGRCLSYGEGITFWALGEMVRAAARISEQDSSNEAVVKIRELIDDADADLIASRVAAVLGLGGASGGLDEAYWAVRRLFESMARSRPLVLVFEDVYWAEPGLLDLIESLARQVRDAPIMLLCLARPVLLERRATWGDDLPRAERIWLEPLGEDEARDLIRHLLGEVDLPDEVLVRLTAAAEGNPLFVEEMLSMLIDRGVLSKVDGRWAVTGDPSELSVPPTISAVLVARLEQLDPDERTVMEVASIGGRVFYAQAAAALAPEVLQPSISWLLSVLVEKQLLRPWPSDLAGFDAFAFRHILIREVTYEALPKGQRAALHERLADWIEDTLGERADEYDEIVGYHCEQAFRLHEELGPVDEAELVIARRGADHLASAGRRALARLDAPAAINLLERASALYPPAQHERLALLPGLARALLDQGDFDRARLVLDELESHGDDDPAVRSYADLTRLELESMLEPEGWSERAETLANRAVEAFETLQDERGLAEAWGMLSDVHLLRCSSADASAAALEAMGHARKVGDTSGRYFSSYSIAQFFGPAPVEEAIDRLEEILEFWQIGRGPRAATLWALSGLRAMRGEFDEARALVEESATIDLELGRDVVAIEGRAEMLGRIEMMADDPAAAEAALREGFDYLSRLGERNYAAALAGMLGEASWEQGHPDDSWGWVEIGEETTAEDDIGAGILWRSGRARVLARRGEARDAERFAWDAIRLAETTDYLDLTAGAYFDLAAVLLELGRGEGAADAADQARERYERKGNIVSAAKVAKLAADAI